jgi:hypothetical protein
MTAYISQAQTPDLDGGVPTVPLAALSSLSTQNNRLAFVFANVFRFSLPIDVTIASELILTVCI